MQKSVLGQCAHIHKHHFTRMHTHSDINTHSHIHTLHVELVTAQPAEVLQEKVVLLACKCPHPPKKRKIMKVYTGAEIYIKHNVTEHV